MLKHAAETLLAFDLSSHGLVVGWCNRNIANPLVRSLGVVVFDVFADDMPKLLFAEEDHLVQAFVLDGSDEAFRVGVEVRRAGRGEKGTVPINCRHPRRQRRRRRSGQRRPADKRGGSRIQWLV